MRCTPGEAPARSSASVRVTAAQIDQLWRLPRATYAHRFGRA
jgi:hypothetical protein